MVATCRVSGNVAPVVSTVSPITPRMCALAAVHPVDISPAPRPRLLALMPAVASTDMREIENAGVPNTTKAHLVVGTLGSSLLRVYALPSHNLVHEHTIEGAAVTGLAADPHGFVLAVCDSTSGTVLVLSWPLVGMALLC